MTLQREGIYSNCQFAVIWLEGGFSQIVITFTVAKKRNLQFVLLYMWGGGGGWLKTSYEEWGEREGWLKNVRIPSYGEEGSKIAQKNII